MQKEVDEILKKWGRTKSNNEVLLMILRDWTYQYKIRHLPLKELGIEINLPKYGNVKEIRLDEHCQLGVQTDKEIYEIGCLSDVDILKIDEMCYKYYIHMPRLS